MKLLLDTQILLWAAVRSNRVPPAAGRHIKDPKNDLFFSAASLWEITIKHALGRADFRVEPRVFRRALLDHGYIELPITSEHAVAVDSLPPLHKDPFDRLLLAQALVEGITLLTTDERLARCPGPVRKV
ncbi:MAG TPA: type II toxin-antitoxin system VapC family toxin [Thermoanaerobaculia bacterium]